MVLVSKALVLAAMLAMEPRSPWQASFEASSETIAKVANDSPVFSGSDGAKRSAALFLSLGWFEGRFDPKAKGDCKRDGKGACTTTPQSLCMFQIGRSNFRSLGIDEESILSNFETCARAMRKMVMVSFGICKGRPSEDLIGHYASGGQACGGLKESKHRMAKARWIGDHFGLSEEVTSR